MLLPLVHNDGRPVGPEKFEQMLEEDRAVRSPIFPIAVARAPALWRQ
jgi:hypothetical protein